jgi:hypothetical protein
MSDLTKDYEAYKSSCSDAPGLAGVALCGICSALILNNNAGLQFHWIWHYNHQQNHALFAPHWHSPQTALAVNLPDSPVWDKTFG